jgi:parallel beta-helix repeat protein
MTSVLNIQSIKASGTIYIRADGSVEGTTSIQTVDNVTYVFVTNIRDSIVVERDNIIIDGNGYTLEGVENDTGIKLSFRTNVTVRNAEIESSIWLHYSSNNNISRNNFAHTGGISLDLSSNNSISDNYMVGEFPSVWYTAGINLFKSSHNDILGNRIIHYFWGIEPYDSSDNGIYENDMIDCYCGVGLYGSSNNSIFGNSMTRNHEGIYLGEQDLYGISEHNKLYHNNFTNNTNQVSSPGYVKFFNTWDDGYPSGGNYWSDYNGTDLYSGVYQNETGYDWIGDSPYTIDEHNTDRYPLMHPFESSIQELREDYWNLLEYYDNLLVNFNTLNASYQQHLQKYSDLQRNYTSLQASHDILAAMFNALEANYTSFLQSNYTSLQTNFASLNSAYNDLRGSLNTLNSSYNNLNSAFNDYKTSTQDELSYTRNLVYVLTGTAVILIVATVYLALRKTKTRT